MTSDVIASYRLGRIGRLTVAAPIVLAIGIGYLWYSNVGGSPTSIIVRDNVVIQAAIGGLVALVIAWIRRLD
jgi:hypothetical protein